MEKYFLIKDRRLVKGISANETGVFLADTAYEYIEGEWTKIDISEINDRLMGYDPFEEGPYAIGNTEIMDQIREILDDELKKVLNNHKGIKLIREYKNNPDKYLPLVDHAFKVYPDRNEFGDVNIGWNAGLIDGNRPYFAEAWATDGVTMMTVFVSTKGIEEKKDEDLLQMLDEAEYCSVREGAPSPQIVKFSDSNGNEFYSINIVIGLGDDIWIYGGMVHPFDKLNKYNRGVPKIISHYGKAYLIKDTSLKDLDAPFYQWLREEGFKSAWYKGHYESCDWCFVNADAKLFAYGMPGVKIVEPIDGETISIDDFKKIYAEKPVREASWKMSYSEYRAQFEDKAEFESYYRKLTEEEVKELIENDIAGTTVKDCMFQTWKKMQDND